uniref:SFRICE_018771 n=1 Tax=Spodoptera frugiperda TaxID=7108 RepID=A0A2H1W4S0_SPOFR
MYDVQAKMHNLQHFVVHEDYNKRIPFSNDIAILFVKKPIQFSKRAKKAILVDNNRWMSPKEKKFVVTGRGLTQFNGSLSDQIKMAVLKYVPAQECSRLHDLELSPDMFCLYGDGKRDTCRGDSGGGVLWRGNLVGLTSHGDGCAKKNKPSVYTNLWYFRHWIKKEMSKFVKLYCRRQNKKKLKPKKSKNML